MRPALLLALIGLLVPNFASAHDPGLSSLTIRVLPDAIEARLEIARADLTRANLRAETLHIEVDRRAAPLLASEARAAHAGEAVLRLRYARPEGTRLRIHVPLLATLPHGHKQYLRVETDFESVDRILSREAAGIELRLAPRDADGR